MPSSEKAADSCYARLMARAYDPVMKRTEEGFIGRRRKELLGAVGGDILEIGAGTGANFPYYPAGASVIAIEPSESMPVSPGTHRIRTPGRSSCRTTHQADLEADCRRMPPHASDRPPCQKGRLYPRMGTVLQAGAPILSGSNDGPRCCLNGRMAGCQVLGTMSDRRISRLYRP